MVDPAARYIVGIDGSRPSAAALDWAGRHAHRVGASLHLVHVVDPEWGVLDSDLAAEAERVGALLLTSAADTAHASFPDLEVTTDLLFGVPAWTIGEYAQCSDIVVVGTDKTGYVSGRVLGSRSVQFALAAPGTVAVVPEGDPRFRHGVVAGIDRVETAALIAQRAAEEARARGMRLTLIHSIPTESAHLARSGGGPLAAATEAARSAAGSIEIRSRVSTRPPAEALLDAARASSLLVVGPGSTGPHRSPLGSTLHGVLVNANAPVLVVRD